MSFQTTVTGFSADMTLFGNKSFEDIAKKAMTTVMPDVEKATKDSLRSSVSHPGESELVGSVKCYEPRLTRNGEGVGVKCVPTGRSSSNNKYYNHDRGRTVHKTVFNNDKAFWLEYGNAHQSAKPWRDRACNNAESAAVPKLENAIAKELGAE